MSIPGPRPLVLIAALVALLLGARGPFGSLELQAYDARLRLRDAGTWPEDLVVVEIDDRTQVQHGGMPWPREKTAALLEAIAKAGARTIAVDIAFGYPRDAAGDARLASTLERVILAIPPARGSTGADPSTFRTWALPGAVSGRAVAAGSLVPPLPAFVARAAGVGHVALERDRDGQYRRFLPALAVESVDGAIPSLALQALLHQRRIAPADVSLGPREIALPQRPPIARVRGSGSILLDLVPGESGPRAMSAADVLEGSALESLEGKLVLVYVAASASTDRWPTPLMPETPGGLLIAYGIRTLDRGRSPTEIPPVWVFFPLFVAAFLAASRLAALRASVVLAIAAATLVAFAAVTVALVPLLDLFLPVVLPGAFLSLASTGLLLAASKRTEIERARLSARLADAPGSGDASEAPTGEIALVFTDVEGSTRLWERRTRAMSDALALTSSLFRAALDRESGYEVKTEGDAFMLAFADPVAAVRWCLSMQEALFATAWPEALLTAPEAEAADGHRGIRVRMGVHVGAPEPRPDPLTGRMDYFGPVVNRAARVSSAAHGGQIIISDTTFSRIAHALETLGRPEVTDLGSHWLKGLDTPERLVQLVPRVVSSRRFAPPKTARPAPSS